MRGDLKIRKVQTASGATAVQVVQNKGTGRSFLKHIGSAHNEHELELLLDEAKQYVEAHCRQPNLFADTGTDTPSSPSLFKLVLDKSSVVGITHQFARNALLACARKCGLGSLPELYLDLALMRIIEPTSKLRSMELLELHFKVTYAKRTLYRLFPELLEHQEEIEAAAIKTARGELQGAVQSGLVRCHHPVLRILQGVRFSEAGLLQGQQANAATDRHWPHHHSFRFSCHA